MKLQKNNKYKNKIAAGLSAIIIASTALTGCNESSMIRFNVEVTPEPYEEYVEPTATPKPTPAPTPTIEEDMESLGIVEDDFEIDYGGVFGLVFKMSNGKIKIVETIWNHDGDKSVFCDAFTNIPIMSATNCTSDYKFDITYDEAEILVPYFMDSELEMIGIQAHLENYIGNNLDDDMWERLKYIIPKYFNKEYTETISFDECIFTREWLAEFYIDLVPRENRVTAEELQTGLEKDSAKVLK